MPINLEVQKITKQEDGSYVAVVKAINNDGNKTIILKTTATGSTKIEFKDALRPKIEKMLDRISQEILVYQVAQTALDELEVEYDLANVVVK